MNKWVRSILSLSTFRSLKHEQYRIFFSGQIISLVGTWMQSMAQAWLVYQLTHSPVWLGTLGLLNTLPMLLFSFYGGSVADRYSKHSIVVVTQSLSLLQAVILFTLVFFNAATVEIVCVLAFTLGTINAFDVPARQSFVIELVGKEHVANAVALNSASFNAARVIGPAIGGGVIGTIGVAWCFFINALSFVAVLFVLKKMSLPAVTRPASPPSSLTGGMKEGLTFIRSDRSLVALFILVAVITLFGWSYAVLLPIYADAILKSGAVGLGNLMMSFGIGALISAIIVASAEQSVRPSRFIYSGIALFTAGVSVFALSVVPALSMASLVIVGMGLIMFIATANASIQRRAPDHLRGRVMGLYLLIFQGLAPFGHYGMGWMAQILSPPSAILSGALICGICGLSVRLFVPFHRNK